MLYGIIVEDRNGLVNNYVVTANTPEAALRIVREVIDMHLVKSMDSCEFQHLLEMSFNGIALLDEVV